MLGYFPTAYPDELLYSILARYQIRSGDISPKGISKALFGIASVRASIDLPCHLNALIEHMPSGCSYTADYLIEQYTLFPFYRPFMLSEKAALVQQSMKGDYGGDIHTRVGIMASSVSTPQYLRFCPLCFQQDVKHYGEAYWHRIHQVPGVLVCHVHNEFLRNSKVFIPRLNKHEYVVADFENCKLSPTLLKKSIRFLGELTVLATDILWLLESHLPARSSDWYRQRYLALLIEKGIATCKGRVYQEELASDFGRIYSEGFLKVVQSDLGNSNQASWLAAIVRKHRKSFHPLRHLLFMRYICGSVCKFFEQEINHLPFGSGPWLCLNMAAKHYLKPVVTDLIVTHCSDTKHPVGTFKCACGFIYSRRGPDQSNNDKLKKGHIKCFGPIWEAELRNLVENEKLSMRETARRLGADTNTIKKYTQILKLNHHWSIYQTSQDSGTISSNQHNASGLDEFYREKWIELIKLNPSLSKTALRRIKPAIYAWLYRHDKEWLHTHPSRSKPVNEYKRVDWVKRDQEILAKVKSVVRVELYLSEKPKRITLTSVAKMVGCVAILQKHSDKLPETSAFLATAVESIEDFQIRRIHWQAGK